MKHVFMAGLAVAIGSLSAATSGHAVQDAPAMQSEQTVAGAPLAEAHTIHAGGLGLIILAPSRSKSKAKPLQLHPRQTYSPCPDPRAHAPGC